MIKENKLINIILADLKKVYQNLNHSEMISKAESKVKSAEKKNRTRLQSIEKLMEKQVEIKTNAFQKFVQDEISKKDYDDLVVLIESKLQHLEIEKMEIKKVMAESYSTNNSTAIKKQLHEFLQFNTLTNEVLLRFEERMKVTEGKEIKNLLKTHKS